MVYRRFRQHHRRGFGGRSGNGFGLLLHRLVSRTRTQGYFAPLAFAFGDGNDKLIVFRRAVYIAAQLCAHRAEAVYAVAVFNLVNAVFQIGVDFVFGLAPVILRIGNDGNGFVKMAADA